MRFYLFTPNNKNDEQELFTDDTATLLNSNFDPSLQIRFLLHGWENNWRMCHNAIIKAEYQKKGDFNIIVVDWSDWANNINYPQVASQIFDGIGEILAEFTKFLNREAHVSFRDMYLIGHSLGAHVAGAAGYSLIQTTSNKYNTIFALDPAGLLFVGKSPQERLDKSHADYVEQITTNMPIIGYPGQISHAAFFPNYGVLQKYCVDHTLQNVTDILCSHHMSFYYFAETINSPTGFCASYCFLSIIFTGTRCSQTPQCYNKILMGGEPSVPKTGSYYLATNDNPPFAKCNC